MISQDQIKERVITYATNNPGCTAIQVMVGADIAGEDYSLDLPTLLETLVDNKELLELEYVLPTMTYRIKSIFFKKDSKVEVITTKGGIDIVVDGRKNREFPLKTEVIVRGK